MERCQTITLLRGYVIDSVEYKEVEKEHRGKARLAVADDALSTARSLHLVS